MECRTCKGTNLKEVMYLGKLYPSAFVKEQPDESYAIDTRLLECEDCGLVQLGEHPPLDSMYKENYWYKSALNNSMLRDLKEVVDYSLMVYNGTPKRVLDIGANDGSLLDFYPDTVEKYAIDPAPVAKNLDKPYKFINDYYPHEDLKGLKFDIITSIAMFYDLPDPVAFTKAIKENLSEDGIWVVQFTGLVDMVLVNAVDNICSEHLEYYKLNDIDFLAVLSGLKIVDVSHNKVNGSSTRVILTHENSDKYSDKFVDEAFREEGMLLADFDFNTWSKVIATEVVKVKDFIHRELAHGGKVYLLGASTKANTYLQLLGLDNKEIQKAAEVNEDKFGYRTIKTDIPIISEDQALEEFPTAFLVGPWHFKDNLLQKPKIKQYLSNGGKLIFPLPYFEVVDYSITERSSGELIDSLVTTVVKCFLSQEKLMNPNLSDKERAEAAIETQKLNARRNKLMRAIDERLDNKAVTVSSKTYG